MELGVDPGGGVGEPDPPVGSPKTFSEEVGKLIMLGIGLLGLFISTRLKLYSILFVALFSLHFHFIM